MSKKDKKIYHLKEEERPLKEKQKLFCEEYIKTLNATRSYKKIYNCTQRTAEVNGTVLLGNTRVQEYIRERLNKVEEDKIASANEVLEFFTKVMRDDVYDAKVSDRVKAGELLGKRYRLFEDKNNNEQQEETVKPTIEIKIVDNSNLEELMYEEK